VTESARWAAGKLGVAQGPDVTAEVAAAGYARATTARSELMGLTTLERVLSLKGVALFRDVEVETLAPVAQAAHEVTVPAGTRLIRTGDDGDCLYVVVEGEVSVQLGDGEEVARRGAGAVFGEMAVISNRPRSADCIAVDEVTVLRVDRDDFSDLMIRHPRLARAVVSVLTERLDEAVENLRLATSGGRA
jgi:CRP-like cAMP-binding protein